MAPDAPAPGTSRGAIHDIGYRTYDGDRLGRGYARRTLSLETLRGAFGIGRSMRSKVAPVLLLVVISGPAVVMAFMTSYLRFAQLPVDYWEYLVIVQVLLTIFVAVVAPAAISRDLRFRVMSLYFSRPMVRSDYVLAKHAATATALFALMALPLTILLVGTLMAEIPLRSQAPDFLRALGSAALLAVLLAALGLLIAALTPRRGVGVAAIVAVLLVLTGVQPVVDEVLNQTGNEFAQTWTATMSPYPLVDGIGYGVLGAESEFDVTPEGVVEVGGFAAVYVLLVAGCLGLLVLRYRKVSVS